MNYHKNQNLMKIVFFFILFSSSNIQAQKTLSVDDAVKIALKYNFDILVAHNDATVAKVNNTAGNAGMLPTVALSGTGIAGVTNTYEKFTDNSTENLPSLNANSISAGAQLSWTLYDGGKMFVTKNKLSEIQSLGEIQFRDKVLQTLFNVIAAYYDVVRQKQELVSINETLNYNKDHVTIAQTGFNAGSLMKTDLLQAKIDLNVSMESAINQQFTIVEAKKTLLQLLGQPSDSIIHISDSIVLNYTPDRKELLQKLNSSNTSILSFQKQIDIANLVIKENRSGYLPYLGFKAGYYYNQSGNPSVTVSKTRTVGPQVSGTLTVPLYSAGENKRKVAVARIEAESAKYDLENTKLQVNTLLENTLTDFENQQKMLQIEIENNELTRENMKISLERLRLGQTTSLEVHLAQEDYEMSCTRLINFKYSLKLAETKLKQLVSTL